MTQVSKNHYSFATYGGEERFASYAAQLREIFEKRPASMLEVGVGEGVMGNYIRRNTAIRYTSIDIADDLHPDVIGDVRNLPFPDASFDVVCAFEVLEHLPFGDFERALEELHRVSAHTVLLSLPHFGPPVQFLLKVPVLPALAFSIKIPYPRAHRFNGQHYWEIGKRGYPASRIRRAIETVFSIEKEFIPFRNQYHHFFVLKKK